MNNGPYDEMTDLDIEAIDPSASCLRHIEFNKFEMSSRGNSHDFP